MAIELRDIRKSFEGRAAVDGVSASIETGAFFVVLGPSGCGKSTLLRLIAGLETLDSGEIRLGETLVADGRRHAPPEARGVGVVFQSYALWPHMSALENVAFPIETAGMGRNAAKMAAAGHLATVSLQDFAARKPAALSGGQRQRVALARCLAGEARTVLMDEPLANLDPHLRGAMEEELAAFHRKAGATTLYITHDQREAMALADRVAVMRDGRFEQVDAPDVVYARPSTAAVARFIGRGALVSAQVAGLHAHGALVELGPFRLPVDAPEGARQGSGTVLLRPEHVALGAHAEARPARILSVAYRGGAWEATAQLLDEPLSEPLQIESRRRLEMGETLPVRPLGGWLLPEE